MGTSVGEPLGANVSPGAVGCRVGAEVGAVGARDGCGLGLAVGARVSQRSTSSSGQNTLGTANSTASVKVDSTAPPEPLTATRSENSWVVPTVARQGGAGAQD